MRCQTLPALFKTHHHCVVCVCVRVRECACACVAPCRCWELNWVLLKSSKCSNHWAIHPSSPLMPKLQVYNAVYHVYPTPIKLLEETVPRTFPLLQLWFLEIIFHRKLEVSAAMFYKYNLLHWFYVSMYIGSHHKLKDTFIVFKEKKTSTGLLLSSHKWHPYTTSSWAVRRNCVPFSRTQWVRLRRRSLLCM